MCQKSISSFAELAHGRHARQAGEPFPADDAVGLELAGIDQRPRDYGRYLAQIHLARQQVDESRACAAIGDLHDIDADLLHEQDVSQMPK